MVQVSLPYVPFGWATGTLTRAHVRQDDYPLNVHGTRGTLKEYNDAHGGPTAYLGTTVPGFPNFFMMQGMLLPSIAAFSFITDTAPSRWIRSQHDHRTHIRHLLRRVTDPTHPQAPRASPLRSTHECSSHRCSDGQVQRRAAGAA